MSMTFCNEGALSSAKVLEQVSAIWTNIKCALTTAAGPILSTWTHAGAQFTEVANGNGYTTGGIALAAGTWANSQSGGINTATYTGGVSWTFTAGAAGIVITGYFLQIDDATPALLYFGGELFASSYTVPVGGATVTVNPVWYTGQSPV